MKSPPDSSIEWLGRERFFAARIRQFLPTGERNALFRAAVAERKYFVEASTGGADDHRRAFVHYTTVDEADELVARVREVAPEVALGLGVELPRVARIERQLTIHLDGGFYRPHRDNQGLEASSRALSYVYFFHGIQRWKGGELVLEEGEPVVIDPEDNSLVFFDSSLLHQVRPLVASMPLAFEEGRFTINGWVWRDPLTP